MTLDISNELNTIKSTQLGRTMRPALHDSIEKQNKELNRTSALIDEFIKNSQQVAPQNAEIVAARIDNNSNMPVAYNTLGDRLDKMREDNENKVAILNKNLEQTNAQLSKIKINPIFDTTINSAQLGEELIDGTGWTSIGWTGSFASGFTNTVGQTEPLRRSIANTGDKLYQVSFRVESPTPAGIPNASTDFTVTIGNSEPFVTYQGGGNFDYTFGIQSVSDGDLCFNPGKTFDGTIKNISVKEIVGIIPSSLMITDKNGVESFEVRATEYNLHNTFLGNGCGAKNTTGYINVGVGYNALANNTTGYWNTAIGGESLEFNTTGSRNCAIGRLALNKNVSGDRNYAIGTFALMRNTHGRQNIAMGADTLWVNTTGSYNVAIGGACMGSNVEGSYNIALGKTALEHNISGSNNIALGNEVMYQNETGHNNIAIGQFANKKFTGSNSIAIGTGSQLFNTTGVWNTAIGGSSLYNNNGGEKNTVIGFQAGYGASGCKISNNVIIGTQAGYGINTGANNNVIIGCESGKTLTTGANNILIGRISEPPTPTSSNALNIGNALYGNLTVYPHIGIGSHPEYIDKTVSIQIGKDNNATQFKMHTTNVEDGKVIGSFVVQNKGNADTSANTRKNVFSIDVVNQVNNNNEAGDAGSVVYFSVKPKSGYSVNTMILNSKGIAVGGLTVEPSARLHLNGGDGTAGTGAIKIKPGILLATPEAGVIEYDGTALYFTDNAGVRKRIALQN